MPLDGKIPADQMTAAAKLLHLADFMATLENGQVDLRTVHHACGAAHCAWGWGEVIGLFPRSGGPEDDSEWTSEMLSAEAGRSEILGLTYQQFRHEIYEALHGYMKVPSYSETIRSGIADFHELGDAETFQFNFWISGVVGSYDNAYYQYRVGLLDEERWQTQRSGVATFFASPGVVQWWRTGTAMPTVSPEFAALVSEILGEEPERADRPQ